MKKILIGIDEHEESLVAVRADLNLARRVDAQPRFVHAVPFARPAVMPMANAIPANEITFTVRPKAARPVNAAMVHTGIPIRQIKVARAERVKKYITKVASNAPRQRLTNTFFTEAST